MSALPALDEAAQILQSGGCVGIPTETVYGLAASIESEKGLKNIFEIKERPFFDPLIVHCSTIEQVRELSRDWSPVHQALASSFWPGPLTLILPKTERVNDLITSGLPSVGVRIPKHSMTLELINRLGVPLAAPSANKFGRTSPTTAQAVREELGSDVLVLDGGPCEVGIESTVLEAGVGEAQVVLRIFRPGMIQEDDLREALRPLNLSVQIECAQSPAAPGQLSYHYEPKIPLVIRSGTFVESEWREFVRSQLGCELRAGVQLQLDRDSRLAARKLYAELRRLSQSGAAFIYFDRTSENDTPAWQPLWNRLERASRLKFFSADYPSSSARPTS